MSKRQINRVEEDEAGIRLDRWFSRHFPHLIHGQLEKLLRTGQVRLDGKRAESATRVQPGQEIRVPPQVACDLSGAVQKNDKSSRSARDANDLKKLVLFEDDDVLVFNKPAGLAVQGGTGLRTSIDQMLAALADKKYGKPKLVHRLDRDTSGVLLVARTPLAASRLTEAFRRRETRKIYWGLTLGVPKPASGKIEAALVRRGETMIVQEDDEEAKSAATLYQNLDFVQSQAAFVAMWPLTGRTHQLRVHMAHIGTPLFGDRLYGKSTTEGFPSDGLGRGLHLHARQLIIPHPRRGNIDVTAPLGPEMRKTWKWFGFDPNVETDFEKQ